MPGSANFPQTKAKSYLDIFASHPLKYFALLTTFADISYSARG